MLGDTTSICEALCNVLRFENLKNHKNLQLGQCDELGTSIKFEESVEPEENKNLTDKREAIPKPKEPERLQEHENMKEFVTHNATHHSAFSG